MNLCYLFLYLIYIYANIKNSGCSSNIIAAENSNIIVILNHNSTNVKFRWKYTLRQGEKILSIRINRNGKYTNEEKDAILVKYYVIGNLLIRNSSLYTFNHTYTQGSLSGYFNFIIKNITAQGDNTDGSKFSYLANELNYILEVGYLHDDRRRKSKIQLWILSLPSITYMNSNLYGKQGDSLMLQCSASGHPAPGAKWIHKDTNTVIAHSFVTSLNITGKESGGQYCCHVSNGYGNAANCTSVKVLVLPRINYLTPNLHTTQEDSITLKCNAFGEPAPHATWIHKDTNTVIAHSFVTSLNITGKASGGQYCCHVSNGHGNADNCTSVSVTEYKPINTKLISRIKYLTRNKKFEVFCKADASPPAKYFIYPDNSAVVNSSNGDVTVTAPADGTSINISCIAKNKYGEGNEVYLKIPIYEPAIIVTHWGNNIVMMNRSFKFHCEATGFPTPNILWYNATDNKTISSENRTLSVKNEGCKNKTLKYFCLAKNIVNSVTTPLTVQDFKDEPSISTVVLSTTLAAVLGVLFALSIVLNILLIAGFLWLRRKDSKGYFRNSDERGQTNDIRLQETRLSGIGDGATNVSEHEPIRTQGIAASTGGIPEYEVMTARTQEAQSQSEVKINNPMPQYESADQHRLPRAYSNPPSVTYQTIQPRTGDYGSLSPSTRLPPKATALESTGSPTRTREYETLQHKNLSPQYQSLDDLRKIC